MERRGVRIIRPAVPVSFSRDEPAAAQAGAADGDGQGQVRCTYKNLDTGADVDESFDTVLLAVGRDAITLGMGLDKAGVEFDPKYAFQGLGFRV